MLQQTSRTVGSLGLAWILALGACGDGADSAASRTVTPATETPIGFLPKPADIDVSGLDVAEETLQTLLSIDPEQWMDEMDSVGEYLQGFGDRLPNDLWQAHQQVVDALKKAS